MKILDENFAVRGDGSGYQLLKIENRHGIIKYQPVSTFIDLQSLFSFYVSSRLSDDMSKESFSETRKTVQKAVKNIRRIISDFESLKTSKKTNAHIALKN